MTEVDIVDAFAHDRVKDESYGLVSTVSNMMLSIRLLTKVYPRHKSMGVIPVLINHITEAQHIKLLPWPMTCRVDWQQHRECNAATDKGHGRGNFQISQKEKGIERMMVQDIAVRDFVEDTKPIEQSLR